MCVRVYEGGRERERMTKNSEQEIRNVIVLVGHGKREIVCVCVCVCVCACKREGGRERMMKNECKI